MDRPRPVPPYRRVVAAVGLGERLEDPRRAPRSGCRSRYHGPTGPSPTAPRPVTRFRRSQPWSATPMWTRTSPCSVNLKALASRFFRILAEALGVGHDPLRCPGRHVDGVVEPFASCDVLELADQGGTEMSRPPARPARR